MPLWGKTDADESKPKWLTDEQKKKYTLTKVVGLLKLVLR